MAGLRSEVTNNNDTAARARLHVPTCLSKVRASALVVCRTLGTVSRNKTWMSIIRYSAHQHNNLTEPRLYRWDPSNTSTCRSTTYSTPSSPSLHRRDTSNTFIHLLRQRLRRLARLSDLFPHQHVSVAPAVRMHVSAHRWRGRLSRDACVEPPCGGRHVRQGEGVVGEGWLLGVLFEE